jgi:hypothetical protein
MNQHIQKLCLIAATTFLASCSQRPVQTAEPFVQGNLSQSAGDQAISVFKSAIAATNNENRQAYMATIHPDSPAYLPTADMQAKLMEIYDVRSTLEDISVVSTSEDEVKIYAVEIVEKISGPAFRSNQTEVIHTFKKYQGEWKIYESQVINIEYLD